MEKQLYDALQARFVKLHFTVAFHTDSRLPSDKVSALRGGMGEMLLRMNCIRDRQCEICDFESECIVQRTMYSKFEKKPEFVTTGGSVGYVLECADYRENFKSGDTLDFNLILFGKTIVYCYQFVQAFCEMGAKTGIGKYHAMFRIVGIKNIEGQHILEGDSTNMNKLIVHVLHDYIMFRKMRFDMEQGEKMMIFDTPLALKHQNEFLQEFQMWPIVNAVRRRIYMLDCFEGIESDIYNGKKDDLPEFVYQERQMVTVRRYSSRKKEKMLMKGIKGYALLPELPQDIIYLLLAGELIHIGKNTSFDFGKYHIV